MFRFAHVMYLPTRSFPFPHSLFAEVVTLCCLVHFFIVTVSIAQPDGTTPMAEFADVFDPSGDPQKAMVGMIQVSG